MKISIDKNNINCYTLLITKKICNKKVLNKWNLFRTHINIICYIYATNLL